MMGQRNTNKFVLVTTLIISVAVVTVMFTGHLTAQQQSPQPLPPLGQEPAADEEPNKSEVAFKVGTYKPQAVFEQHPLREKLMESYASLQPAIQEAQQQGDQEKAMQLQQQFEQERTQIVQQFESDVREALPEIAEEAGVKVIALEITYTADDVAKQDVTTHLVETFVEEDERERPEPRFQFPREQ